MLKKKKKQKLHPSYTAVAPKHTLGEVLIFLPNSCLERKPKSKGQELSKVTKLAPFTIFKYLTLPVRHVVIRKASLAL